MSTPTPSDTGHRTAGRVLDILEVVAASGRGLALHELSALLKAPKSSLLPLLRTLHQRGYLTHDDSGVYHLGVQLLSLRNQARGELDLREVSRSELQGLSRETGEATLLATLSDDHTAILYIDKMESVHRIRFAAGIGERRPLHSTSSGRVLLAFMPDSERDAVIKAIKLERYTEETLITELALRAELERVRAQGYCINIDQATVGRCAIAAPVFDCDGQAVAAIVLGAPKERALQHLDQWVAEVCRAAGTVSGRLGHRPEADPVRY
ncbi:IclR family acetate operon transcriptional repressor [Paraburkholderia sp. WC7.3g]|nr:IclR family transcriptional regulator [Paraburkholderia podalyriae]